MSKTRNKHSVAKVMNARGQVVGYLSNKDIEQGLDISLDMQGFIIEAL